MVKRYAGIGSRNTPKPILKLMTRFAEDLGELGYTLRSGGAKGADSAFYNGSLGYEREIYVPYRGFSGNPSDEIVEDYSQIYDTVGKFHPNWNACRGIIKSFHARNYRIVMGHNEPVDFVICWTPNGKDEGGTGMGIRIADYYGIPVYNLRNEDHIWELEEFIKDLKIGV